MGHDIDEIIAFYERGLERDRLGQDTGPLELARTQAILERHLPPAPALVADIGGGPGRYALWLAERGYRVRLVDPVPLHVEQARAAGVDAEIGNACALPFDDDSCDAAILLGPLYHLPERDDRVRALAEARRVCRPNGVVIAAAISRFASTLDGLRHGYLVDPEFAKTAANGRETGQHRNPTGNPAYFTTAYFHRPGELAAECLDAGLTALATIGVEGPAWLMPNLDAQMKDERSRSVLLDALDALGAEPTLLGVSAHLLVVAHKR